MFENVTSRYDMSDATIEIVIMLLVAFLLGALLGYFLCRQCCEEDRKEESENNDRFSSHDNDDDVRVISRSSSPPSNTASTMNLAGSGAVAAAPTVVDKVEDAVDDTSRNLTESVSATVDEVEETVEDVAEGEISDDWKPEVLDAPIGESDDLKRISGVGPVIEKTLNELGIFHYKQISDLDGNNVKWLDNYIAFPGRITRENWTGQAKDLMEGVATDFADRYDSKK